MRTVTVIRVFNIALETNHVFDDPYAGKKWLRDSISQTYNLPKSDDVVDDLQHYKNIFRTDKAKVGLRWEISNDAEYHE